MDKNNTEKLYTEHRGGGINKEFLQKLQTLIESGYAQNEDLVELKKLYNKIEKTKFLAISKEELFSLGGLLDLRNEYERKDMKTVLSALKKVSTREEYNWEYQSYTSASQSEYLGADDYLGNVNLGEYGDYTEDFLDSPIYGEDVSNNSEISLPYSDSLDDVDYLNNEWGKDDFNYREPIRDSEGKLLARKDLPSAFKINDEFFEYSTTKELFTKLNSLNETQVEPLFKPIHNGEGLPTFVIVGDMHADEYGISGKEEDKKIIMELQSDKKLLTESDESSKPEIDAVNILKNKFGVDKIGLENVFNSSVANFTLELIQKMGGQQAYQIGEGLEKLGIDYVGLENIKEMFAAQGVLGDIMSLSFSEFYTLGVDLSIPAFTKKEFIEYYHNNKALLEETDVTKDIDLLNLNNQDKTLVIAKIQKLLIEKNNFSKKELIGMYKFSKYVSNTMFGKDIVNSYAKKGIEDVKKLLLDDGEITIEELSELEYGVYKKFFNIIVKERNRVGIENMVEEMGDDNKAVMVYGKAHIKNLIEQLLKKYNGKVNIYVAK